MRSLEVLVKDNEKNLPVTSATVLLLQRGEQLHKLQTNDSGYFEIPADVTSKIDQITITALGYEEVTLSVNTIFSVKGKPSIALKPHVYLLDEVAIKGSNKRYQRDTLNFMDSAFTASKNIKDIFSRPYGFDIKNGQLYYNGLKVAKLTVNGKRFFSERGLNIFDLLPAKALGNIEVVTSNIDSLTNTVQLKDHVDINVNFKEQYKQGQFGNFSIGGGTAGRKIAMGNFFSYDKNKQTGITLNTNNVNIRETLAETPLINYNGKTSDISLSGISLSHKYEKSGKFRGDILIDVEKSRTKYDMQTDRKDFLNNTSSTIRNSTEGNAYGIKPSGFNITFKPDSLNEFSGSSKIDYEKQNQTQHSTYNVEMGSDSSYTHLDKDREQRKQFLTQELSYKRSFQKKGRFLLINAGYKNAKKEINERNTSIKIARGSEENIIVENGRDLNEHLLTITSSFNEPLNENSYINIDATYQESEAVYSSLEFDELDESLEKILSKQFLTNLKFYRTAKEITFNSIVGAVWDNRSTLGSSRYKQSANLQYGMNLTFLPNTSENITFTHNREVKFPDISQLTSIENTYDPLYQTYGNTSLKPEIYNSYGMNISSQRLNPLSLNLSGNVQRISQRIGMVTISDNELQRSYLENLGSIYQVTGNLSAYANLSNDDYINVSLNFNSNQLPTVLNGIEQFSKSKTIALASNLEKTIVKDKLSVAPALNLSHSDFNFAGTTTDMYRLTYSDNISVSLGGWIFIANPLINYDFSISKTFNYAVNASLRYKFMKGRSNVWLQVHDLFDSFRFNQGVVQNTHQETIKLNSVGRYIVFGWSTKLSNIK